MANPLVTTARIAIVLCAIGLAAAGCGRKGDLDKPSTPVEQNLRKTATQNEKHPGPASNRSFLLDPLL